MRALPTRQLRPQADLHSPAKAQENTTARRHDLQVLRDLRVAPPSPRPSPVPVQVQKNRPAAKNECEIYTSRLSHLLGPPRQECVQELSYQQPLVPPVTKQPDRVADVSQRSPDTRITRTSPLITPTACLTCGNRSGSVGKRLTKRDRNLRSDWGIRCHWSYFCNCESWKRKYL